MQACKHFLRLAAVGALSLPVSAFGQTVRSGSGINTGAIQAVVDQFRTDLGALNPNVAGSAGSGRREINWDGVPDTFAAPNNLPADFFNVNSPRGAVFSTPGTGFQVSADSDNPTSTPVEFANINPNYNQLFAPFSAQRLFTAVGSNIVDVNFFIPGSTTPATVRGFGAVFSDVDVANSTSIQYFDANGNSLGTFSAQNVPGNELAANETFSFLGVSFDSSVVSRVRITSGNQILGPNNLEPDLVVMDDFIYGEPVPEPATLGLLAVGLPLLLRRRR